MMENLHLIFLAIGTLGFCVNLYLAIQNPELEEGPMGEEPHQEALKHPLHKLDTFAYWVMWIGWGLTAVFYYLNMAGLTEDLF